MRGRNDLPTSLRGRIRSMAADDFAVLPKGLNIDKRPCPGGFSVPRHSRPPLLMAALVVAAAGTAAGLAAAARVGPFDALGVAAVRPAAASVSQAPLAAGPLYPSPTRPPSVHQIIEISDPPRVVQPSSPPEVHPTSTPPSGEATPRATAAPTPSPGSTPCPDGCQGGGGGDN
jgi:hypothetical protein